MKQEWFSDNLPLNADAKIVIERVKGAWIMEAGELNGMRKGEVQHPMSFCRTIDRAWMSYDRAPASCCGDASSSAPPTTIFLRDQTGNRRYWPIQVEDFKLDKLKADRDQLWAEAAAREAQGDSIRLGRTAADCRRRTNQANHPRSVD